MPRLGAKKGHPKWGGRVKGTPNRKDRVRAEVLAVALQNVPEQLRDITPLETILLCMHWAIADQDRPGMLAAAAAAAPYCHNKLASTEVRISQAEEQLSDEELLRQIYDLQQRIADATQLKINPD